MKMKLTLSVFIFFVVLSHSYAGEKSNGAQSELNKKCEIAREKKLKPKRNKLIKKCISEGEKTKEECISFYSTYGDAKFHSRGNVEKRLYDDLPECVKVADR